MDNEYFKTIPAPQEPQPLDVPKITPSGKVRIISLAILVFLIIVFIAFGTLIKAPKTFPVESVVVIEKGETLSGSTDLLFGVNAIRSKFAFKVFMVLFGGTKGLDAGEYYLEKPQNSIVLAWRFSKSKYDLKNVKITIPEGLNVKEVATLYDKEERFKYFDKDEFIKIASVHEGYLFPDTYLFLPTVRAQDIVDTMLLNYETKIATITEDIKKFGRRESDVIKMASILEEEGRMEETRKVIADILWKRLDEKMPLQVDASVVYATGKTDGNKLSAEDFKLKSPYNTYLNLGFPPTPISSPGLDAIKAAISPTKTKYYFYLTDPQGGFHPATTYDGHLMNKAKYLGT